MKFRIKKGNGKYFAECRIYLFWCRVPNSSSFDIEETKLACRLWKKEYFGTVEVVENFEL